MGPALSTALRWLSPLHRQLLQRPRRERLTAVLARLAGPAATMLDVGAGDGSLGSAVAAAIGARVEGVDVLLQAGASSSVRAGDGAALPHARGSFEIVLLSDVLHHAADPGAVLASALSIASRCVIVKDHFEFGRLSHGMLVLLDLVGNLPHGVEVPGTYFTPRSWCTTLDRLDARLDELVWPLDVHPPLVRAITRSELQFAARIVRAEPT